MYLKPWVQSPARFKSCHGRMYLESQLSGRGSMRIRSSKVILEREGEEEGEGGHTNRLAPGQASGVELLDISLQFCPDTQVSFDPVHMLLIPGKVKKECQSVIVTPDPSCPWAHILLLGHFLGSAQWQLPYHH